LYIERNKWGVTSENSQIYHGAGSFLRS